MRRRTSLTHIVVTSSTMIAALAYAEPAQAEETYEGTAAASGARIVFSNESIPLGIAPQLEGPVASARLSSLDQADASAAFPSPGEDLAALPGTAAGTIGAAAPSYPFAVRTAYGDGARRLSYPGIELASESGDSVAQASATGGSRGAGATSLARVTLEGDSVHAVANSAADGLRLGDSLVVDGLRSTAEATRDPLGKLTRSSSLSFTSLSAPGLTLTLPAPPGSSSPGQTVTAPQVSLQDGQFRVLVPGDKPTEVPVPAGDVLGALGQAGYHVTYQAPVKTANGIVGAGLQIETTLPAPPPGAPAGLSGQTPVTFVLGMARAEISYRASVREDPGSAVVSIAPPPQDAGQSDLAGTPRQPAGEAAALPRSTASGLGTSGKDAAVPAPERPGDGTPGTSRTGSDLASLVVHRAPLRGEDVGWLYAMVAALAAALGVSTVILRMAGVRG